MGLAQCSDPTYSSALFCLLLAEPRLRFQMPLVDVEVLERQDAVLECQVPLETIPAVWYLEDKRLQPSPKYLMEEQGLLRRLTVRDARADDDGIYLCEMEGKGRSVGELSVHGEENLDGSLLGLFEWPRCCVGGSCCCHDCLTLSLRPDCEAAATEAGCDGRGERCFLCRDSGTRGGIKLGPKWPGTGGGTAHPD